MSVCKMYFSDDMDADVVPFPFNGYLTVFNGSKLQYNS